MRSTGGPVPRHSKSMASAGQLASKLPRLYHSKVSQNLIEIPLLTPLMLISTIQQVSFIYLELHFILLSFLCYVISCLIKGI